MNRPRRFGRLHLKFALVTLALVMGAVLSMAAIMLLDQKTTREEDMHRRWVEIAGIVQVSLSNAVTNCEFNHLEELANHLAKESDVLSGAVYNRDGVCVFHSQHGGIIIDGVEDEMARRCIEGRERIIEIGDEDGLAVARVAVPILSGDRVWGSCRVDYDASTLSEITARVYRKLIILSVVFLGLGILGSLLLARHVSGPVVRLSAMAKRVAAGDLDTKCALTRADELGDLGRSFDGMVTDLRLAHRNLEGSRRYVESIVASMLDSLVVVEPGHDSAGPWMIRTVNPATTELLGYGEGELVGCPVSAILGAQSGSIENLIERIRREGGLRNLDLRYRKRDGSETPVRFSASPMTDAEGAGSDAEKLANDPRFVFVASDVSQLERAERIRAATYSVSESVHAAATTHDLFRSVHEILAGLMPAKSFAVAMLDAGGEQVSYPYHVDGFCESAPDGPLGSGLVEHALRDGGCVLLDKAKINDLQDVGSLGRAGRIPDQWLAVPLLVKEKTIGLLIVQSYEEGLHYRAEDRDLLMFISDQVAMAVERKRVEEERARLSSAVEQAIDTILILDQDGKVSYANPAFSRVSGHARDAVIGRHARTLQAAADGEPVFDDVLAEVERIGAWTGRLQCYKADETVYQVEAAISPVRDDEGRSVNYVSVQHDITQEMALQEQLRQSQKMEAVGKLAGGVAHDFNNLLSVINGYAEMLLEEGPVEVEDQRDKLEEIHRAGTRASSLTRQLLAFSRRQVLRPRKMSLNDVVIDMEKMLRRLIGEDVVLRTKLETSLSGVEADPGQIEQVIMNLAVNARDAMREGGHLTIKTQNTVLDETYQHQHPEVVAGRYAMLAVSDTGAGIDAETCERIFEPFFTTKGLGEGTGLGLSTVYGIIKQSGGHISVYSEVDHGTTFRIYLPRVDSARLAEEEEPQAEVLGGTETVLLVEDEEGVRKLTKDLLTRRGYHVITATDGDDALRVAASRVEPIHLLLTDVVMPGLSVRDLVASLQASRPDLRVLYMSGYTDGVIEHRGILGSDVALIEKPFPAREIALRIRAILDAPIGSPA
jgi:PAS domain S-box-containing protein